MSESHEYRVWAPHAERMRVVAGDESVEMAREESDDATLLGIEVAEQLLAAGAAEHAALAAS